MVVDVAFGADGEMVASLMERLAELELALEDPGWFRLSGHTNKEFSRDALDKINEMARAYWLKNPLVRRAILTKAYYVFGQGIRIQAEHPLVNKVVQAFLDDPDNRVELTSHQAWMIKEIELECFANLFFVFFVNESTGRVKVRTMNADEIREIITDPEDAKKPRFYKRVWTQRTLNEETGQYAYEIKTAFYPSWCYKPAEMPKVIGSHPVMASAPVYHVKVNALSDMEFGVSEVYSAIDWARAYKGFLENWATITKAYAMFAWKIASKAGPKGIQTMRDKLSSTLGTTGAETNPAPAGGSALFVSDSVDVVPLRTAGATTAADDGRRLLLMVSAATGIFEHYFGDPSTGNLATAKAMERPMELMFRDRQQLWVDILQDVLQYVIRQTVKATSGKLPGKVTQDEDGQEVIVLADDVDNADPELRGEPISNRIDVKFPDILEKDVVARITSIVSAATLDGKVAAGTIERKQLTRMFLIALGEENVDETVEQMFPKEEKPSAAPDGPVDIMVKAVESLCEVVKGVVVDGDAAGAAV